MDAGTLIRYTRLNQTWTCSIATASAFTFVATWPTTRAELILYNGEPATGKSYIIQSVYLTNITSQAAAQPFSLLAQVATNAVAAAPTNDTAQLIMSNNGTANYGGNAKRAVANTAFAVANKWQALGTAISPMTTNLGATIFVQTFGQFIIPPTGCFCLAGLAGTAAGTAICGVTWSEAQI